MLVIQNIFISLQLKHRLHEGDDRKHQEMGHIFMIFLGENNFIKKGETGWTIPP